jgi:hypothetical protein
MSEPAIGAARVRDDKRSQPKLSSQGVPALHPLLIHFDKLADTVNVPAEEAAILLNCALSTLYRWCGDDDSDPYRPLRPIKMGHRLTFKVGNLRAVMKNGIPSQKPKPAPKKANEARRRNAAARRAAREREEAAS